MKIKAKCESKGAMVIHSGIINWGSKRREEMILDVIERLGNK